MKAGEEQRNKRYEHPIKSTALISYKEDVQTTQLYRLVRNLHRTLVDTLCLKANLRVPLLTFEFCGLASNVVFLLNIKSETSF